MIFRKHEMMNNAIGRDRDRVENNQTLSIPLLATIDFVSVFQTIDSSVVVSYIHLPV